MKIKFLPIFLLFLLGCNDNDNLSTDKLNNNSIESEIIEQTIKDLIPELLKIDLVVPLDGGEDSETYNNREKVFKNAHNKMKNKDKLYVTLSNVLSVPVKGERYTCSSGLPKEFINYLYNNSVKNKEVDCSRIKKLYGIRVVKNYISHEKYNTINKPGCYGYIEYSRMYFSNAHKTAHFIFKYRLNGGNDYSFFVKLKKKNKKWKFDYWEELDVYFTNPSSSIEPTYIIDTIDVPPHSDKDYKIEISSDINGIKSFPTNQDIKLKLIHNGFNVGFTKFADFELSIERANDLEHLTFYKIRNNEYILRVDPCYSKDFIEYDFRLIPKRGYVLKQWHNSGSMLYINHIESLTIDYSIRNVDKTNKNNCL